LYSASARFQIEILAKRTASELDISGIQGTGSYLLSYVIENTVNVIQMLYSLIKLLIKLLI